MGGEAVDAQLFQSGQLSMVACLIRRSKDGPDHESIYGCNVPGWHAERMAQEVHTSVIQHKALK